MTRTLAFVTLTGLCAACPPAACDDVVGPTTVEVGTGLVAFASVPEGSTIEVIHGAQGGYHVLGAVRATGIWEGDGPETWPEVDLGLVSDDGAIVDVIAPTRRRFGPEGDAWVLTAELVVLDITSYDGVEGTAATLAARVTDACGADSTDTRAVVLTPAE